MKIEETEQEILIPEKPSENSLEVEISKQEERIIIVNKSTSIWDLGANPVESDINDGAINHNRYLYSP